MPLMINYKEICQHLSFSRNFKIVSFGCGPGTEIIGFQEFLLWAKQKKFIATDDFKIKYVGVDLNEGWHDYFKITTQKIQKQFEESGIKFASHFYAADVLNFKLNNEKIDVLILPYVLSEMKKHSDGDERMRRRVGYLLNKVKDKMRKKALIICNDINHNTQARDYFDILYVQIDLPKKKIESCFKQNKSYYKHGMIIEDAKIDNDFPQSIVGKYNVWKDCTSAQTLIFTG
jgi:hypothetical protein